MRRSLLIFVALVVACAAVFWGSHQLVCRLCAQHLARPTDDLDWLRREFRLTDAELARVRSLHEGYLPKCQEICDRIAAKKRQLQDALSAGGQMSAAAEQQLKELAALRAQCQTQMLRHFGEVSQVMPPEQGRRYAAKMQRLTLGFHEQIEASMSGQSPASHGPR